MNEIKVTVTHRKESPVGAFLMVLLGLALILRAFQWATETPERTALCVLMVLVLVWARLARQWINRPEDRD